MYEKIGSKIKILAKVMFFIGSFGSIMAGVAFMIDKNEFNFIGIIILVAGIILSLVTTWLLYGFGELIEKTSFIATNVYSSKNQKKENINIDCNRINEFEKLRFNGLISEEEFQKILYTIEDNNQ